MEHSFIRDKNSYALLNRDKQGLENYRSKREQIKKEQSFKQEITNEISELKKNMNLILELLQAGKKS